MSNCLNCGQPVYYWYKNVKHEYKSDTQILCSLCAWSNIKKREDDKEMLDLLENPKFTERQIEAAFKLISKDEEKKSRQKSTGERKKVSSTLSKEIDLLWKALK